MATKGQKPRARLDSDTERKLIDVWADILGESSGIMMTRKKKEAIATTRLNAYVSEELNRPEKYTEEEVSNKFLTGRSFEYGRFTTFFAVAVNVNGKPDKRTTERSPMRAMPWRRIFICGIWRDVNVSDE